MGRRLCAAAMLLAVSLPIFAAEGVLEYYDGIVDILSGSETFSADFGMEIEEGDVVRTGEGGIAIIGLESGAKVKLRANTILVMDKLGTETAVTLKQGGVFSQVARRMGRTYEVRTPSVAAGVRGTEFFVAYGKTIDSTPDVWLCVNEGSVEVSLNDVEESILVKEGEGINIVAGIKLTEPRFYPWTKDLIWNMDPESGDVTDDTDLEQAYSDLLNQDYD